MTDHLTNREQATLVTASHREGLTLRGPRFTPFDVAAFVVSVLMIWGPLAAGALRQ